MGENHKGVVGQLKNIKGFYVCQDEFENLDEATCSLEEENNIRDQVIKPGTASSSGVSRSEEVSFSNCRKEQRPSSMESLNDEIEDSVAINFQPSDYGRYISTGRYDLLRTRNIRLALTKLSRRRLQVEENFQPADIIPCSDYDQKTEELLQFIKKSSKVADIKLSFYIVACEEQPFLKPFPVHLVEESEEGFTRLMLVNEEIPCVKLLEWYLSKNDYFKVNEAVVSLLHWLFISLQDPKLKCIPPESFLDIYNKVDGATNFERPHELFRAMYNRASPFELKWQALKGNKKSKFAFYADTLNIMHSLIHLGFHPTIKTNDVYGCGIYLFSDLKKCMEYSGRGWGWGKSEIGTQFKTILVVEFLEDPEIKKYNELEVLGHEQKALTNGTIINENSDCYYVPRAELLRIRYVCVYVKAASKTTASPLPLRRKRFLPDWFQRHKRTMYLFGTIVLTYATTQYYQTAIASCIFFFNKVHKNLLFSKTN